MERRTPTKRVTYTSECGFLVAISVWTDLLLRLQGLPPSLLGLLPAQLLAPLLFIPAAVVLLHHRSVPLPFPQLRQDLGSGWP